MSWLINIPRLLVAGLKGGCMSPKQFNPFTQLGQYQSTAFWLKGASWLVLAAGIGICKYNQTDQPTPKLPDTLPPYTQIEPTSCSKNRLKAASALAIGLAYTGWEYYRFQQTLYSVENQPSALLLTGALLLLTTSIENIQLAVFSAQKHDNQWTEKNGALRFAANFPSHWIKPITTVMRMIITRISISKLTLDSDPTLNFSGFNLGHIIKTVAFWGWLDFFVRASNNSYATKNTENTPEVMPEQKQRSTQYRFALHMPSWSW